MDPFEKLPCDIHDELLQYFSAWDLLDVLSLVSKSWNEKVGSSSACMKKIRLNLRSKRKNDFAERVETLKWMSRKGGRSYQHLTINCLLDEGNSQEVWGFLESVSGSVETINIRSMKFDGFEVTKLSMPKLEELKMMFVPRDAMNSLLSSSSNLKKLILRNEFSLCYDGVDYNPSDATLNSIKECVRKNSKLEELEIQGRPHFFSFFHENLVDTMSFHLKKLVVKIEISAEKIQPANEENLLAFLSHQASSLEHLYVDSCGTRVIQKAFNDMPKLKFIRFDIMQNEPNKFVIKDLNLVPNERITQLEIPYIVPLVDVKDFLTLVPNVEELLTGHMTPMILDYAANNLMKLKLIVYRYDDCAGGCDSVYLNMKRENPDINQAIAMTLCNDFM